VAAPDRVGTGNRSQVSGPTDAFQTLDGWVLVQVVGDPLYRRWARLMGEDRWLTDPRFAGDRGRGDHRDEICARMSRWCGERSTEACLETLAEARIPAGPVLSPQAVLDHPQVAALGVLAQMAFPGLDRPAPVARVPVGLSETPGAITRRAPEAGEHTDEILAAIGYDEAAIAEMRTKGVV